jgi:hypothetical protein
MPFRSQTPISAKGTDRQVASAARMENFTRETEPMIAFAASSRRRLARWVVSVRARNAYGRLGSEVRLGFSPTF